MARLIVSPGTAQARQVVLKEGVIRIGRGPANDVTIEDGSVSGSHCQLIVSNEAVLIRDVGSTNGTCVNGTPVVETNLQPGQSIQLGTVQLLFEPDPPSASEGLPGTPGLPSVPPTPLSSQGGRTAARLRIAHETEPPAVPEPAPEPVLVPDQDSSAAAVHGPANAHCKYHPRSIARWVCTRCQKTYCDLCVTIRGSGADGQKYCRNCMIACSPLHVTFEPVKERTFFSELPRAVVYPFRGAGVLMLIGAMIVFAALDFMSRGIIGLLMRAVALGYVFAFAQNIIHTTASGDDKMPTLPAMEGLFSNFFRLAVTALMAFGPALVVAYFTIAQEESAAGIALIPAVVFGCLYFPMGFLAVAIKDNVMACNPLVVVPSIVRVPLEYIVTAVLLAGVFFLRWKGDTLSGQLGHKALMTSSMSEMFLLFGFRMFWAFFSVYLLTVTMRVLGLLYLTKRDRLGW